tara:strand:- start:2639 stop:3844 length:1206 start_codon:yes stop_codon:yes gene_type:complete
MLEGKNVILGITASIAAYKSTYIVRLLKKLGASVKVIQTESSTSFVTPLSLSTLSENQVVIDVIDKENNKWISHVELGLWADIMIIAPITAKTMSKMVQGNCDNQLIATYLSAKCPVYFAPAMDLDMYKHQSTKNNINKLISFGNKFIKPNYGELASGLIGEGRMAEPEEIIKYIIEDINSQKDLYNINCLVTAGPTYENIDPIRYIGNKSTGKMGLEISKNLANRGAKVKLIMGPSNLKSCHPNISQVNINTADQMYNEVEKHFDNSEISVFSAAVSDYKPKKVYNEKYKKINDEWKLDLIKNRDIISEMSFRRNKNQYVVGFALESENEIDNAIKKLKKKKMDMIILNSIRDNGSTFGYETNKITIIDKKLNIKNYNLKNKSEVANDIVEKIIEMINNA